MGITFADSGDYLCQTEGAETGVFHEYLRLFCITDRATLPQQKLQGFISLCREQALSWAKLTFWQLMKLMFFALHTTARLTDAAYNNSDL